MSCLIVLIEYFVNWLKLNWVHHQLKRRFFLGWLLVHFVLYSSRLSRWLMASLRFDTISIQLLMGWRRAVFLPLLFSRLYLSRFYLMMLRTISRRPTCHLWGFFAHLHYRQRSWFVQGYLMGYFLTILTSCQQILQSSRLVVRIRRVD